MKLKNYIERCNVSIETNGKVLHMIMFAVEEMAKYCGPEDVEKWESLYDKIHSDYQTLVVDCYFEMESE